MAHNIIPNFQHQIQVENMHTRTYPQDVNGVSLALCDSLSDTRYIWLQTMLTN